MEQDPIVDILDGKKPQTIKPKSQPTTAQPHPHNNNLAVALAIIALLCGGGGLGLSIYNYTNPRHTSTVLSSTADGNSANFQEGSIAEIANQVSPSVVSITTEVRTSSWYGESTSTAAGTGFIISEDGYIMTNKHVVDGAKSISVILDDGTSYDDVQLIGTDPLNDAAILKINGVSGLPAVTLGDSKTISVGQQVIAIGNALGVFGNSVTQGIISGQNRSIVASDSTGENYERLSDLIQTDATINQGNSGGPLVNAAGQVIGINSATSATGQNLGFAIPIGSVKGMIEAVKETGQIQRAYLGVYYINLTPDVAKEYNLNVTSGAYLKSDSGSAIISGGPASRAGLKDGDIITAVNGVKVGSAGSVSTLVGEYRPGDKVQLTVYRDGKEFTIDFVLGAYGADQQDQS